MNKIHTSEDIYKVRKLAIRWYSKIKWEIPNKVYGISIFLAFLIAFFDNNRRIWWVAVASYCYAILYGRNERLEGYVDGWFEGQTCVKSDIKIDKLLED